MKAHLSQSVSRQFGDLFGQTADRFGRGLTSYLFAVLLLAAGSTLADGNEEEDMIQQDVMFSTPADISSQQKNTADEKGYSLLGGAAFFTGRNNNVHQSPDSLSTSSSASGNWLFLRSDKQFGKSVEIINSFVWKHRSYGTSSASTANFSRGYLSSWMEVRLAKNFKVTFDFDVDGANDDATKITGVQYRRDYSYTRYSGESILTWNPSGPHRFQIGGNLMRNNYDEIPNMVSYDWNWREGTVRYRYRFAAHHYLKVAYSVARKSYDERPSYSAIDPEFDTTGNPVGRDRYREFKASWELPAAKWFDASLTYSHGSRTDLFEGARSWTSDEWQCWFGLQPSRRLEVSTEVAYMNQDFANRLGDFGEPLTLTSWNLQAGARFALTNAVRLFTSVDYRERDTNRNILPTYSYSSYLDYSGVSTSIGISFFFLTK